MNNPQYRLLVHPHSNRAPQPGKSDLKIGLRLLIEGSRDLPLNLMLLWKGGERVLECVHIPWIIRHPETVVSVMQGDIVATSGPYSHGVAHASTSLTGQVCAMLFTGR